MVKDLIKTCRLKTSLIRTSSLGERYLTSIGIWFMGLSLSTKAIEMLQQYLSMKMSLKGSRKQVSTRHRMQVETWIEEPSITLDLWN